MNALDCEQLNDLVDEFGEEWVVAAILEANASRRDRLISIRFVEAILRRWSAQGFKAPYKAASKGKGTWYADAEGLINR